MTSTLISPEDLPAALPGACSLPSTTDATSSPALLPSVGAVRQAEDALDRDIEDLSNRAVHARAAGDKAKTRDLVDRMYAAIRSRSPEHQARLEQEAWEKTERALNNGVDYFQAQGRAAGRRIGGDA